MQYVLVLLHCAESIAISKELVDSALECFNGIYLITPFMRYDIYVELVEYIHEKTGIKKSMEQSTLLN